MTNLTQRADITFRPPQIVSRDQQTIELRQFYPLPGSVNQTSSYALDAYFFLPRSFGITPQTWNRDVFYRNTNILSRLHAPGLSLAILCDVAHPNNPAHILLERITAFMEDQSINGSAMTALAQIFGAELTDAIRAETKMLLAAVRQPTGILPAEHLWEATEALAAQCLEGLAVLRRVRAAAQAFQAIVPPSLLPSLTFAEEYASAVIDESLSELAMTIGKSRSLHDGSCVAVAMRTHLAATLEELNSRRRTQGFVVPRSDDAEYYSYRLSLLKKELQRSMYVNTRSLSTDPFYTNTAAIVAAGLAATWATLAQVPLLTNALRDSQGGLMMASGFGIAAYMVKDRMKDWVKARLTRRWSRWDHDIQVQNDSLAAVGLGAFQGAARERFRWEDESSVPDEVTAIRRKARTVRGASSELEQVFHYRRWLSLSPVASSPLPAGYGIEEMLRLNLDDVLRRLDDPSHTVSFYHGSGRFATAAMPKVYHLNVVTVVNSLRDHVRYAARHRIVLNKHRILRVESVA